MKALEDRQLFLPSPGLFVETVLRVSVLLVPCTLFDCRFPLPQNQEIDCVFVALVFCAPLVSRWLSHTRLPMEC